MYRISPILLILFAAFGSAVSQTAVCTEPEQDCVHIEKDRKCVKKSPVIEGKRYVVPGLRIRFFNQDQKRFVSQARTTLRFNWEWLEYPYPDKLRGAWSDASSTSSCITNNNGQIDSPKLTIVPTGWYKGFFSFNMKPRFVSIFVALDREASPERTCSGETSLSIKELEDCKRRGTCDLIVKFGCSMPTSKEWN